MTGHRPTKPACWGAGGLRISRPSCGKAKVDCSTSSTGYLPSGTRLSGACCVIVPWTSWFTICFTPFYNVNRPSLEKLEELLQCHIYFISHLISLSVNFQYYLSLIIIICTNHHYMHNRVSLILFVFSCSLSLFLSFSLIHSWNIYWTKIGTWHPSIIFLFEIHKKLGRHGSWL